MKKKHKIIGGALVFVACQSWAGLVGQWEFNDPDDLGKATVGTDVTLNGSITATAGIIAGDGAAKVSIGDYITVDNLVGPNGGGANANRFTIVMDIKVPVLNEFTALMDFEGVPTWDANYFIRKQAELSELGLWAIDYAGPAGSFVADTWYRFVWTVDNGSVEGRSTYLDGTFMGANNAVASDQGNNVIDYPGSSIASNGTFTLFWDNNNEESVVHVSNVMLYDTVLTIAEVAALGMAGDPIATIGGGGGSGLENLIGLWEFKNTADLTEATVGSALALNGTITATPGVTAGDGAAEVGVGEYITAYNTVGSNGGGSRVNQFSLLMDFKVPSALPAFSALFEFTGEGDSDYVLRKQEGAEEFGVAAIGYAGAAGTFQPDTWYRLVYAVDSGGTGRSTYLDGAFLGRNSHNNTLDYDRGTMGGFINFFSDNGGGEESISVISTIAVFDTKLTSRQIGKLGGPGRPIAPNRKTALSAEAVEPEEPVQTDTGTNATPTDR